MKRFLAPQARDTLCALSLAAVVGVFFGPALLLRRGLFFGDAQNYAMRLAYTARGLAAGHFPLWNPYLSFGASNAADPVTLPFYPPHLALALVLGERLFDLDAAFHMLLAALGTFWFIRLLRLSRPAALLAAVAYAFSGFAFAHLQHLNILVGLGWTPVLLATIERYLARLDRRSQGFAAASAGFLLLGGHPQITLYGLAAGATYALFRVASPAHRRGYRRAPALMGLFVAFVLGTGLAAVYLLPFAEWMAFVGRAQKVTPEYAGWYSLPWFRLSGLVAPFFYGGSLENPRASGSLIEYTCYAGLVPLALAVVALARPKGPVIFFSALGVAGLVLSMGTKTPLYAVVLHTPAFASVRAPARFAMLSTLSVAILSAFGLDALRSGRGRALARITAALLLGLAVLVARAAWLRERSVAMLPARDEPLSLSQYDTVILLLTLFCGSALLGALQARAAPTRSLLALTLGFASVDAWAFKERLFFYQPAPAAAFAGRSSVAKEILSGGPGRRLLTESGRSIADAMFADGNVDEYERQMWESLATSLPMHFALQSATGYLTEPSEHGIFLELVRRHFGGRAARLAGVFSVSWVVAAPNRDIAASQLLLVRRGLRDLYLNTLALPRAYLAADSIVEADPDRALGLLSQKSFDPRQSVILDTPGNPMPDGPLGEVRATIVTDESDRVVISASAGRAAWLVLNDAYAPGWTATVDGHRVPLLRANTLVRAIVLPAGEHQVAFVYAPSSFKLGLLATSVAALIVGILLLDRVGPPGWWGLGSGP